MVPNLSGLIEHDPVLCFDEFLEAPMREGAVTFNELIQLRYVRVMMLAVVIVERFSADERLQRGGRVGQTGQGMREASCGSPQLQTRTDTGRWQRSTYQRVCMRTSIYAAFKHKYGSQSRACAGMC
eukprot:GHVU01025190.1.p1 GENE.GHVU01025190.1~~GHVU01025190.1.p1  ORF type:complete len:126 (-),score=6.09 GHVU01025190.1:46-423(-)